MTLDANLLVLEALEDKGEPDMLLAGYLIPKYYVRQFRARVPGLYPNARSEKTLLVQVLHFMVVSRWHSFDVITRGTGLYRSKLMGWFDSHGYC